MLHWKRTDRTGSGERGAATGIGESLGNVLVNAVATTRLRRYLEPYRPTCDEKLSRVPTLATS